MALQNLSKSIKIYQNLSPESIKSIKIYQNLSKSIKIYQQNLSKSIKIYQASLSQNLSKSIKALSIET